MCVLVFASVIFVFGPPGNHNQSFSLKTPAHSSNSSIAPCISLVRALSIYSYRTDLELISSAS
jgi:hypothetical protein